MQQYTECLLVEIAITPSKSIRNAKIGGVMKNWGYLLQDGHWFFQNLRSNDWETEALATWQPLPHCSQ